MSAAEHRPGVEPVQVAGEGWRYWGTCSCGWRTMSRFPDKDVALAGATLHVEAVQKTSPV